MSNAAAPRVVNSAARKFVFLANVYQRRKTMDCRRISLTIPILASILVPVGRSKRWHGLAGK